MLLLSTYSLKWYWIHRILEIVKKSNYDWLDLYMDFKEYDLWDINYIKEIKEKAKIDILSISTPNKWLNKIKVDKIFDIAKALWVQLVTFSPPHVTDKNKTWFTKYLQEVKNDFNFNIAIQNIENKYIFFIIPEYRSMPFDEIKKITWYTSLEIANIDNSSSIDIIKASKMLWASMKNVFFSDKKWDDEWILPWKESWWISNLPLESFLMNLKANAYNWFITLKVSPDNLWVWDEEEVLKNLEKVKNYYKKYYLDFK